ncbi:MAG: alpha/beta hydrolase fold domain-containing protein [Culicoidibacterales bacterium]
MKKNIMMCAGIAIVGITFLVGCQEKTNTPTSVETATKTTKQNQTDIAYATKSDAQKFDLSFPTAGTKVPVVLNIHGGGFMMGDKAGMSASGGGMPTGGVPSGEKMPMSGMPSGGGGSVDDALKTEALKRGYAFASTNYRLSGEAPFPAAINDVKACIRYLKAHADELGIDANRIYVIGGSAGGNLAALAGTSGNLNYIGESENLGNESQSSSVAGVVDMFGPINFLTMDSDFKELGVVSAPVTDSVSSAESRYIGAQISTQPEKVAQANPTTYLDANDPKMLIEAGSIDKNIPYLQGKKFADAANQLSAGKATWTLLEGEGHGTAGFSSSENIKTIMDFLDNLSKK